MKVLLEEFTTPDPITLGPEQPAEMACSIMEDNDIRHLPVVEDDIPIGVVNYKDLVRIPKSELSAKIVRDFTRQDMMTASFSDPISEVAVQMSKHKKDYVIVVNKSGGIDGIFTETDVLNALIEVSRAKDDLEDQMNHGQT